MSPSRSSAASTEDTRADTIPVPPPSAAKVEGDVDACVESRVESRRRDTIPAPAPSGVDADGTFDEEPPTDRAPTQLDAV